MIEGVIVTPLHRILDERGAVFHMLRADQPHFERFGEIYFSMIYPGVVKAWHIHDIMRLNYSVPIGVIKMVLYDDRPDSSTKGELMEIFTGELDYKLITVPPRIWNGFKGIGTGIAMVANCSTHPHDPNEIHRLDPFTSHIPYDWGIKNG